MSTMSKKSSQRAQYQMIIDAFKNDGVVCNFRNKTYYEDATYLGGTGYRSLFKQLNDETVFYHKLLKALTGERRANIYETIPVIDFLNFDNTSLINTHRIKEDNTVENTAFYDIDMNPLNKAKDYIEKEDKSTLNRAVMGQDMAEHFYNTSGQAVQCQQLQTSFYNEEDFEFIYKGEIVRNFVVESIFNKDEEKNYDFIVKSDLVVYKITNTTGFLLKFDTSSSNVNGTIEVITEANANNYKFIQSKDTGGFHHALITYKNDIIVVVPKVNYVNTVNKILYFKADSNEDKPVEQKYSVYLLFVEKYDTDSLFQATTENISVDKPLPSYLLRNDIKPFLEEFISLEKNYYSDASGLLNGLFCEPYEWSDLGDSRTVTKWKLCNDAYFHNEDITVGSKYAGHGLATINGIKSSPLKLTTHDQNSAGTKGKAQVFYNTMMANSSSNLTSAMTSASKISNWSDYNSQSPAITSMVTRYDYDFTTTISKAAGEEAYGPGLVDTTDHLINENKFKVLEGNTRLTIDSIDSYLDTYDGIFKSRDGNGFATRLDLTSDKNACTIRYDHRRYNDGWAWTTDTHSEETSQNWNDPSIDSTYIKSVDIEYSATYGYNYPDDIAYKTLKSVSIISPYSLFKKQKTTDALNSVILVYPEVISIYPGIMYLMTRSPLFGITKESDFTAKTRTLFLNNGNNFLILNIDKFYNFSMKYLQSIHIQNVEKSSNPSLDIDTTGVIEVYRNLYMSADWEIAKTLLLYDSAAVGDKAPKFLAEAAEECYVYKLSTFNFGNGSNEIKIYDADDKQIPFGPGLKVAGASYPASYFELSGISSDENHSGYDLISTDIKGDAIKLKTSSITLGIPDYQSLSDLWTFKSSLSGPQRYFLDSFYDFINDEDSITNVFTETVYKKCLGDFNVAIDDSKLPLRDVPSFIDNLRALADMFSGPDDKITTVDGSGNLIEITYKDFEKLRNRLNESKSAYNYHSYSINFINFDYDDQYGSLDTKPSFYEAVTNWINNNTSFSSTSKNGYKYGLLYIRDVVKDVFEEPDGITLENARLLDNIFGNNTEPFINMGASSLGSTIDEVFSGLNSKYYSVVKEILAKTYYYGNYDSFVGTAPASDRAYLTKELKDKSDILAEAQTENYFKLHTPINIVDGNLAVKVPVMTEDYELTDEGATVINIASNINADEIEPVVSLANLQMLSEYVKSVLEGIDTEGRRKLISFTKDNQTLKGNSNGLYYKRYEVLNCRMNTINGPLHHAGMYLKNAKDISLINSINDVNVQTYKDVFSAIPVADIEPMSYLQTQTASETQIELQGKFYSDKEMEALRNHINSSCVLTCTNCKIKDSCPFYDQEEVLKLYCTGLSTIDLYVKDNELELLDKNSFNVQSDTNGAAFNMDLFDKIHDPYADIVRSGDIIFSRNALDDIRDTLQDPSNPIDLKYKDYVQDDLGWLIGGRYGTVTKNTLKDVENEAFENIRDQLHDYKYLYDAVFVDVDTEHKDTNEDSDIPVIENDSYIDYKISDHTYEIDFEVGPPGHKVKFSGTTKIKVPCGLKLFKYSEDNDKVFLVSDDETDPDGLPIVPCIYLGKVSDIQLAFDYSDDGYPLGVTDPNDQRLYAKDIAQWCANYYKGILNEDPIGYTGDELKDRDQYWMEYVYKKIDGHWYEFPGRRRADAGYADPLIDTDSFDEVSAISGHPVVNTYVNFVRKVSIRMYDDTIENEKDRWLVPFVDEEIELPWPDLSFEQNVEIQKRVLSLMKTNLRLVVIHQ